MRSVRIAVLCDEFPVLTETFVVNEVEAMREHGHEVRVLALERGAGPSEALYLREASRPAKLAAFARLAARRPAASLRDLAGRREWRPAERPARLVQLAPAALELRRWGAEHLHVHFAAGAAMEGLRLGALLNVPVSITAHAHDIFRAPRNLTRKLERAAFVTTGCAYNVRHLERVAPTARVHEIRMGVDPEVFVRRSPHPERGPVLAIGRLVEKKGFGDLVRAAALLPEARVRIVGEGPLRLALAAPNVELLGAQPPERVRGLLEEAAVLAMPCVVAADGDRDSMPVAVKEAMAMEVPVVVTDEVGLPELVDESCGRLVPPGDPEALAAALAEALVMSAGERAVLGRAGRAKVVDCCDVRQETRRLLELIATARAFAR